MTDWQTVIAVCLMVMALTADRRITAVMLANFFATMAFRGDPAAVAIADIAAALIVLQFGPRGMAVAALFAAMIPIYIAGQAFAWPNSATYAIIDVVAFAQMLIAGKADGGIAYLGRALGSRLPADPLARAHGAIAARSVARHSEKDRR